MNQNLATLVLVLASFVIFFIFTAPLYNFIEETGLKVDRLKEVKEKAEELSERESELQKDHEVFVSDYKEGLESMVPVGRDDARTLMIISSIAEANNVIIREATVPDFSRRSMIEMERRKGKLPYGAKTVYIEFDATYQNFAEFLTSMERSRRIFDPIKIDFSSSAANVYEFEMRVNTYWIEG